MCIIGGGLAGITAGLLLAESGIDVVLFEADDFTQYRAGEHIAPQSIELLKQCAVPAKIWEQNSVECFEIKSTWGDVEPYIHSSILNPLGGGLVLRRPAFDRAFFEYSITKGLKAYVRSRVVKTEKRESKWVITYSANGSLHTVLVDWILDASGRNSKFMPLGNDAKTRYDKLVAYSFQSRITHSDVNFSIGGVQIKAYYYGWWYACRLSKRDVIISLFTDPDIAKKENIKRSTFHRWFEDEDPFETKSRSSLSKVNIRAAHTQVFNQFSGEQWLAIGDAAWSADPLSSQGMYKAIVSGYEATQALLGHLYNDNNALENYCKTTRKKFLRYLCERSEHYRMEKRWQNRDFWKRRHYPTWVDIPINLNPLERIQHVPDPTECGERIKVIVPRVDLNLLKNTMVVGDTFTDWVNHYKAACVLPASDKEIIIAIQELMT